MPRTLSALHPARAASSALKLIMAAVCIVALSGCLSPYRMDIQQGNVVTQDMIDKLKPGMSQREVKFILGSPMVEDPFHANRWDYVYSLRKGREKQRDQSVVTVMFEDNKLVSVDGTPTASSVEARRISLENPQEADPEKAKKKGKGRLKGLWNKVKGIGKKKPKPAS